MLGNINATGTVGGAVEISSKDTLRHVGLSKINISKGGHLLLDPKNITQELINPAIQAFSKRLDKPQQIREAVGLMATKAEIEKDLSKETDALAKEKTIKQKDIKTLLINP